MSGHEGTSSREVSTSRQGSGIFDHTANFAARLARDQREAGIRLNQQAARDQQAVEQLVIVPEVQTTQWERNQEQAGQRRRNDVPAIPARNQTTVEQRARVREKSPAGGYTYK